MTRAKLSGSLLVSKEIRTATAPANLSTILREATEKARGGPVLVWSTGPKEATGSRTAPTPINGTNDDARGTVAPAPATDLDAPAITGGHEAAPANLEAPSRRWMVSSVVAVAVSILAIGGVSGSLFPQPDRSARAPDIALSVADVAAPEPQRSALATTAIPSRLAPESAATDVASVTVTPQKAASGDPSTDTSGPDAAEIAATADPVVADAASPPAPNSANAIPSFNSAMPTSGSGTPPDEAPGSAALKAALLERGDTLFATGDLAAARMFYERAAGAGHGQAALHLGETYDPAFLARTGLIGARGDAAVAAYWYRRARELGAFGADILLAAVSFETDTRSQ